jgi:hypothetical protein
MIRLGRYAFYWLATSAVLALIGRSGLMRRTPVRLLAAATSRALCATPLPHPPAPKKRSSASSRRRSTRAK